ncbi:hypothetical protein JCM10212_005617 [Sporobolomyces blumeae]
MAAPSSSYSALLRRSKLATYNPQIEQVYTTSSAHLARQNFGLKRPLPSATTKTSPFVRVTDLDSKEGRTIFRKGTREASFVKKWGETGVGLQSEAYTSLRKWDPLEVQSRFVPPGFDGQVKQPREAADSPTRTPNFLVMSEREFEQFLETLGARRVAFKEFVATEAAKVNPGTTVEDFDLYAHAQSNPNELVRLVERFLRLASTQASVRSTPLPQVHPTLALQYATPTPLESALAKPVPGRLLGPSPEGNGFNRSSPLSGYRQGPGTPLYSSVLSTIAPVSGQNTGGLAATTFYPDASSIRSNEPGRATFRLTRPTINPHQYAQQTAIETKLRKSAVFRPETAEYQPRLLAMRPVDLDPVVDTPAYSANLPALRHAIGSPAYSGAMPPEARRTGPNGSRLAGQPRGMAEFIGDGKSYKSLGVNQRGPRDLMASKRKSRTRDEHEKWTRNREALLEDRQNDNRTYGNKRQGKGGATGKDRKKDARDELVGKLASLLNV